MTEQQQQLYTIKLKSTQLHLIIQEAKRVTTSGPQISLQFHHVKEEAEAEWFYEDLQDLLEPTSKKDVLFIIGD